MVWRIGMERREFVAERASGAEDTVAKTTKTFTQSDVFFHYHYGILRAAKAAYRTRQSILDAVHAVRGNADIALSEYGQQDKALIRTIKNELHPCNKSHCGLPARPLRSR